MKKRPPQKTDPKILTTTPAEASFLNRIAAVEGWQQSPVKMVQKIARSNRPTPQDRTTLTPSWERMEDRKRQTDVVNLQRTKLTLTSAKDYIGTYHNYNGILRPEYDMLEPFVIYDTEPIVKQAISRRLSLMFRNGFEIVSDLQQNADYIQRRLDVMEYVLSRDTETFFKDILFNLFLCSNCFLRKVRDKNASPGVRSDKNNNQTPVAGYIIIPAHEILPYMKKGQIDFWRRFYTTGSPYEDIAVEDIEHLHWDVKPGHIFGTPRTTGVREDIFALRRLEENIELLFINYLFPLFHVKIGDEAHPCWYGPDGQSEIDIIRHQIETMPKEGVFATDERVEIDSVGAEGQSLDTKELIAHLKQRIYTGLGVSALDMGEGDSANRSTADNISQNLKDAIKADGETFAHLLRIHLFKEWFQEANYSNSIQKAFATTHLQFHEIDLDNLIKHQNHMIQLWLNNLVTLDEARRMLKFKPMKGAQPVTDEASTKRTYYQMITRDLAIVTAKAKAEAQLSLAAAPGAGTSANKARPANQHGRNPGPTKAKSSRVLSELKDRLIKTSETLWETGQVGLWAQKSSQVVEDVLKEFEAVEEGSAENSYTRQARAGQARLSSLIAQTSDSEMLAILLDSEFSEDVNGGSEVEPDSPAVAGGELDESPLVGGDSES